ncbi:hypothetical protein WA158_001254 [Blastocystis sp. Blastoise]
MSDTQSQVKQKNYYAILGVSPLATQEEIRTSFRQLSRVIHPDKQPMDVQVYANHCFSEVETAYRVLSNPQLRKAYDSFGEDGVSIIESGANGLVSVDDTAERVEEIIRFITQRQFESRAGQSSSFSCELDISSILNKTERIHDMKSMSISHISLNQMIETQITPQDTLILAGSTFSAKKQSVFSAVLGWKRSIDETCYSNLTLQGGQERKVHFDLVKSLDRVTTGIWGIELGNSGLGVSLRAVRQMTPELVGSIQWGFGSLSGVSFNLDNVHENGKNRLGISVGEDTSLEASASRYINKKKDVSAKISFVASMQDISVETLLSKNIGEISKVNMGLAIGVRGVFLNFRYLRGSMRFILPIQLSHQYDNYTSILMGYGIPLSFLGIYYYYTSKDYKKAIKEYQAEEERRSKNLLASKRIYAQVQVNMLKKLADKKYKEETDCNGLIIVKAVYGDKRYVGFKENTNCVDVTMACRYLVSNSTLKLYAGTKQDYIGFYNPSLEKNVELALYVRYINNGILYEKTVDDVDPLFLPSSVANKIGIASQVE